MIMTKRILCIALTCLMLCVPFVLASCGDEVSEAESTPVEESKEELLVPSLGKTDAYSGKTIRFFATGDTRTFGKSPLAATETDSEPVNNACLERFVRLENEYGITVETKFVSADGDFTAEVRNDRLAGTVDYDVVCNGVQYLAALATEGYFLDQIGRAHV